MAYRNRERVARVLAHEEADRVPFDVAGSGEEPFVNLINSMNLPPDHRTFALEGDFKYIAFHSLANSPEQYLPYLPGLPEEAQVSDWGVGKVHLVTQEGYEAGWKTWCPLAGLNTVEELEEYPWPDFTDPRRHADLEERLKAAKNEGYTVIGQMSQTIVEICYGLRGIEQLMIDFYERPEYVEALFEKVAERRRFQARRMMEAGADILRIGDDIATQESLIIGPALYRERIKPFHASVIATARKIRPDVPVLYHSDGNLTELIPDLMDAGVTAIHPVQPECMDLGAIKREYGKDLILWGCRPMQSVFAHGSHDDARKHMRFLMETMAPGGGLVVGLYGVAITPKILDNARVFYEEFYEAARY